MPLKEKMQAMWDRLVQNAAEKVKVETVFYTGDVQFFLTEGRFDWDKLNLELEADTGDSKVRLLIAQSIDMVDGDGRMFVTNDPELQALLKDLKPVFDAGAASGIEVWKMRLKLVSDLLSLVKIVIPV